MLFDMPYLKEVLMLFDMPYIKSHMMLFNIMPYLKEVLKCCYISVTSCLI